jgi:hypothetical protein
MNNQMAVEIYTWTVPQENVQVQEMKMEPKASLFHDYGDGYGGGGDDGGGGGGGDGGGGGGGDGGDLDESWVLD